MAERKVLAVCKNHAVGQVLNLSADSAKDLHQRNPNHYAYTVVSGYVEAFTCNVFVGDDGKVIAVHILKPDGTQMALP